MEIKAWCMKDKKMMPMDGGKAKTMKNGRKMMLGVCSKCGTKMAKIM